MQKTLLVVSVFLQRSFPLHTLRNAPFKNCEHKLKLHCYYYYLFMFACILLALALAASQ